MKKLIALFIFAASLTCAGCDKFELEEYLPNGQRRCQAITQKDTQCKRAAEDGYDYCWQHKDVR